MREQHTFSWNGKDCVATAYGEKWYLEIERRRILGPPLVRGRPWELEEPELRQWLELHYREAVR